MNIRFGSLGTVGVVCFFLTSCGGANPLGRQAISGEVTLDGAPVEQGVIQFTPEAGGESRVGTGAVVQAGRYSIPADKGLPPGRYKVMVFSGQGSDQTPEMPGDAGQPPEEKIPAKYNVKSELVITVSADGPNEFPIVMQSE